MQGMDDGSGSGDETGGTKGFIGIDDVQQVMAGA